jgi:serine protease Do
VKHFVRHCGLSEGGVRGISIGGRALRGILIGLVSGGALGIAAQAQSLQMAQLLQQSAWLLAHSHSPSYLGVDLGDVDQDRAQALHLKDTHGAEITVLDHDAPAGKVGLKLHDVILQVDDQNIENAEQLKRFLHDSPPGRKLKLVYNRDGVEKTVTVQMADRRKVQEEAKEGLGTAGASEVSGSGFLSSGTDAPMPSGLHVWSMGSSLHVGALVEPLTAQMADFLGVSRGVMIKSVAHKSAADAAGLKPHDVILGVGGEAVMTSSDWERLLRSAEGKPVQVEIMRDRVKQLVLLQVDGKRHKVAMEAPAASTSESELPGHA